MPLYRINLGSELQEILFRTFPTDHHFIIFVETVVHQIWKKKIRSLLGKHPIQVLPGNEKVKNFRSLEKILRILHDYQPSRSTVVLGIGGGAFLDTLGFSCSIYQRGLPTYFLPTTLLGMIDSSIGGKNAVNFLGAKNVLGTHHLAGKVIIDPEFLKSLPPQELRSGWFELLKNLLLVEKKMNLRKFDFRKIPSDALLRKSIRAKLKIVQKDYWGKFERNFLNFGHTFGHAFESRSNYTIPHGVAIGIGMAVSLYYSKKSGFTFAQEPLEFLMENLRPEVKKISPWTFSSFEKFLLRDKKRTGTKIKFIYLEGYGKPKVQEMTLKNLQKIWKDFQKFAQST